MYFEEYSTTPNLTGKSLSYNDMIISIDCKVPSNNSRNERFLLENEFTKNSVLALENKLASRPEMVAGSRTKTAWKRFLRM